MRMKIFITKFIYILIRLQCFICEGAPLQTTTLSMLKPLDPAEAMLVMNACYAMYNISEEQVAALYKESMEYLNENSKAKCTVLCMLKRYGILDEEGYFLKPYTEEEMKEASKESPIGGEFLRYLNRCVLDGNIANPCERAINVVKCHGGERFITDKYEFFRKI